MLGGILPIRYMLIDHHRIASFESRMFKRAQAIFRNLLDKNTIVLPQEPLPIILLDDVYPQRQRLFISRVTKYGWSIQPAISLIKLYYRRAYF